MRNPRSTYRTALRYGGGWGVSTGSSMIRSAAMTAPSISASRASRIRVQNFTLRSDGCTFSVVSGRSSLVRGNGSAGNLAS